MVGQPLRMLDGNDLHGQLNAFVANESLGPGDQLQDLWLDLSTEGACWFRRPRAIVCKSNPFLSQSRQQGFDVLRLKFLRAQLIELIEGDDAGPVADFSRHPDDLLNVHLRSS